MLQIITIYGIDGCSRQDASFVVCLELQVSTDVVLMEAASGSGAADIGRYVLKVPKAAAAALPPPRLQLSIGPACGVPDKSNDSASSSGSCSSNGRHVLWEGRLPCDGGQVNIVAANPLPSIVSDATPTAQTLVEAPGENLPFPRRQLLLRCEAAYSPHNQLYTRMDLYAPHMQVHEHMTRCFTICADPSTTSYASRVQWQLHRFRYDRYGQALAFLRGPWAVHCALDNDGGLVTCSATPAVAAAMLGAAALLLLLTVLLGRSCCRGVTAQFPTHQSAAAAAGAIRNSVSPSARCDVHLL